MNRYQFQNGALALSYLDAWNTGRPLIALHAHWMEGLTFAPLSDALGPEWRVIALDQRGHGYSDHAPTYTRADYVRDIEILFEQLGLNEAVVLGNSLGGVNAYQFAARHPDQVEALIIEDIGVEVSNDISFCLPWAGLFTSRDALAERIGPRLAPYLEDSFRNTPTGWRVAFDPQDMVVSQSLLNGDHWKDWLATTCPALLLRGRDSQVTIEDQMEEMAARRPNTSLHTLAGGHVAHVDNPAGFVEAVKTFLTSFRSNR